MGNEGDVLKWRGSRVMKKVKRNHVKWMEWHHFDESREGWAFYFIICLCFNIFQFIVNPTSALDSMSGIIYSSPRVDSDRFSIIVAQLAPMFSMTSATPSPTASWSDEKAPATARIDIDNRDENRWGRGEFTMRSVDIAWKERREKGWERKWEESKSRTNTSNHYRYVMSCHNVAMSHIV